LEGSRNSIAEDHNDVENHATNEIEFCDVRIETDKVQEERRRRGRFEKRIGGFTHEVKRFGVYRIRGKYYE